MIDLVVRNGWVVTPREMRLASVAIDGQRILKIGPDMDMPRAKEEINAAGRYVIPGLVDMHVHYGITGKEMPYWRRIARDIEEETLGAAYGGMTTHFPMLAEPDDYAPVVRDLIEFADSHSYINTSFTVIVQGEQHIAEMPSLHRMGVSTFKHFFNPYKNEVFDTLTFRPVDEGELLRSLEMIRELGAPALAMVHAEDCSLYEHFDKRARERGLNGLEGWAAARPNICEYSRVELACMIALEAHAPIHFVHMSCGESIEILQRYRARGLNVSAEVVTANISSTYEDGKSIGVWGKFCPPIRGPRELERLWEGIRAGAVDHIATDHCGYRRSEKEGKSGQFGSIWEAIPGISNGQEHMLPAAVTYGVKTGRISLQELVALCCENNAKRFGLFPRKGQLAEGADADIAVVDLGRERVVDESFYHGRGRDHSLFWGRRLSGYVTDTIVLGRPVIRDGEAVGRPGTGKYAPQRAHA